MMLRLLLFSSLLAAALGCGPDTTGPLVRESGPQTPTPPPTILPTPTDPTTTFCQPGARRCLFENSPLFEQCAATGRSNETLACADGEVCRDGQCGPFTCVPGRSLCVSPEAQATCDETGRAVRDISPCADDEQCLGGACTSLCDRAAREQSYIGCEYIAQELFNYYRADPEGSDSPYGLVVANPSTFLDARLEARTGNGALVSLLPETRLVPSSDYQFASATTVVSELLRPQGVRQALPTAMADVIIPPGSAAVLLVDVDVSGSGPYFLKTNQPVVAYQFSPYCCNFTASNDASLLLPTTTLQNRYRVISYPTMSFTALVGETTGALAPYFYVIGVEDSAQVEVKSPALVLRRTPSGENQDLTPAMNHTFTLARGEVMIFEADTSQGEVLDLSGAEVVSDEPVSVFVGHPCTFVPQDKWACDHLEEQLLPASTLGQNYLLQTVRRRNPKVQESEETVFWRIVADENARITLTPPLGSLNLSAPSNTATPDCRDFLRGDVVELPAGEVCEFGASAAVSVASDAPLVIAGIISGHQSTGILSYGVQAGDPAMFLSPPVEQFRRDYTFVTPPTFQKTYASIAARAGANITYNDRFITPIRQLERREVELDGEAWEIYSIALEPGVHKLASDQPFGLLVYAYDDYVSYAFPGGLDLKPKIKQ